MALEKKKEERRKYRYTTKDGITAILFFSFFFFFSCAPPIKYSTGMDLIKAGMAAAGPGADSIRAVLKLTIYEGKKKNSVTGIICALPEKKYKLDFMGPLGSREAGFYWVRDSIWTFINLRDGQVFQGQADSVGFPFFSIEASVMHRMLGFLWGNYLLPGEYALHSETAEERVYMLRDSSETVSIDRASGLVKGISLNTGHSVVYEDYRRQNDRPLAHHVTIRKGEDPLMEVNVQKAEDNPEWNKPPFFISIPGR